jgi:hypothetical protein
MIGFMLADGNITQIKRNGKLSNCYAIKIEIITADEYILKEFQNIIGSHNHIHRTIRNRQNSILYTSAINVQSTKMAHDLFRYGIIPNKTFKTYLSNQIPFKYMRDYIRGIFDGDGTVYKYRKKYLRFAFYGTYKLMFDIREFLYNTVGLSKNAIITQKNENVSFIPYAKKQDCYKFYHYIYDDANLYLKRKKQIFDKFKL